MSEFSDLLETCIMHTGLSETRLAESSGFSRSYIAKLKNGQRLSPDTEKMERLFACLQLSQAEYTELWNRYLEERQGKEKYGLTQAVLGFVSSSRQISKLSAEIRMDCALPDVWVVEGREDVDYFLKLLIEQEALGPSGYLKILAQPECGALMDRLKNAFKLNHEFRVDHLICLNNDMKRDADKYYNIELLQKIIPAVLCGHASNYRVYYNYDRVQSHFNRFNMMPYLILSRDRVVQVDYEFEHAVICRVEEKLEYFSKAFQGLVKTCPFLYESFVDDASVMQYWARHRKINETIYAAGNMPFMMGLDMMDIMYPYVTSCREELEAVMRQMHEWRKNRTDDSGKIVSYFTEAGIHRFMEEGRIMEIPEKIYMPLQREDRRVMIRRLLEAVEQGFYEPRLIRTDRYQWPGEISISMYNYEEMALYYDLDGGKQMFRIEEKTITRRFYEFMEMFGESAYVCSVQETVEYLERLVDEEMIEYAAV